MNISPPIVKRISDNRSSLDFFENEELINESDEIQEIISLFPTIYIHNWMDTGKYDVYIGESNNVFSRTRQHYEKGETDEYSWQREMINHSSDLFIIGHEHFNKSLTLDIENKLMHYMSSVPSVRKVHNMRDNPQNKYYTSDEMEDIFSRIWTRLRRYNKELFPTENYIRNLAIFKASPLHKLTPDQLNAQELIISRVRRALSQNRSGQIIFVEGEAGTGKTVLNSSTFYEIFCQAEEDWEISVDCKLIVNHDEQLHVYKQIAERLGLSDKYGEVVCKPTRFINSYSPENPVDYGHRVSNRTKEIINYKILLIEQKLQL